MNNILVMNGSPKGKNSITLHTCLFLEKKFPVPRRMPELFQLCRHRPLQRPT